MASAIVSTYSNEWPNLFCNLKEELICVFAGASIKVGHVGSNPVPGLSAKPVIDVPIGATSLADIELNINRLIEHRYVHVSKHEKLVPNRGYFV